MKLGVSQERYKSPFRRGKSQGQDCAADTCWRSVCCQAHSSTSRGKTFGVNILPLVTFAAFSSLEQGAESTGALGDGCTDKAQLGQPVLQCRCTQQNPSMRNRLKLTAELVPG